MKAVEQLSMVSGPSAERMFAPGRFQVRLGQGGFRNEQDVPGTIRVESVARVSAATPRAALREDPHIACAHAGYNIFRSAPLH
jgi:hypothetical protein